MAKKKHKAAKQARVPKEDRYPRGIALAVIAFLTLFMPMTLAVRLVCILFVACGMTNNRIATLVGCHVKTVRNVRRRMDHETVSDIMVIAPGSGRKSKAKASVKTQIAEKVKKGTFSSLMQIADMVKISFNLTISTSTVSRILKGFNIRKLKSGSLPYKADVEKQRSFFEETLHPLMEDAKQSKCVLIFMDASHFVMGCDFLGYFYSVVRKFVKTLSGRKRYNVLGAMNYCSKEVHTITNDSYITAPQVCRMLVKLYKAYKGQVIKVILDNASYQKCAMVQKVAEQLGIILVFIPPYSPNLNLIERFWKFVKAELRTSFYDDFVKFCDRIDEIIASSTGENKPRVESLIGEKVQLFDDLVEISEYVWEPRQQTASLEEIKAA